MNEADSGDVARGGPEQGGEGEFPSLDRLESSHFEKCLHEAFQVQLDTENTIELELIAVKRLKENPAVARPPFVLRFRGSKDLSLSQRIYPLEHKSRGTVQLFLIPRQPDDSGTYFEVIFN